MKQKAFFIIELPFGKKKRKIAGTNFNMHPWKILHSTINLKVMSAGKSED